jgi:hypothetical protein
VLDQFKGRWLATYDDCERVRACVRHHRLAARGFASRSNHRNKLKYELVIARDLRWCSHSSVRLQCVYSSPGCASMLSCVEQALGKGSGAGIPQHVRRAGPPPLLST